MRRRKTALLVAVLLLAGLVGTQPAAAAVACGTGSSPTSGLVREAHPVVLAHGWTGVVMSQTRTRLEAKMGKGWQFLLFDYHDASASWASSPQIAGCFAIYLKAVSDAHLRAGGDGLVYVVAHSMGGLALRFAVDPRFGKIAGLGDRIGGLVSLATPHRGSPWGESGVYTQIVNLKNTLLLDAVPKGQEAARCLALHDAAKGLPTGCDPPPYLPAKIRVDQVAGVATVRRSFFGVHAYDIALGGDSIVPQDSAQGYLGSAQGSNSGRSTRLSQVACSIDWDAFGAVLSGGELGAIARLRIDGAAMDAIQGARTSPALLEFLAAANTLMACSHIGITTNDDAIDETVRALHADAEANDTASLPVLGAEWAPSQEGFGTVRPGRVYFGNAISGSVDHIAWRSWGESEAIGVGVGYYVPPGGDSQADPMTELRAVIHAYRLGTCRGKRAYTAVTWYFPSKGERFEPMSYLNACTGDWVDPGPGADLSSWEAVGRAYMKAWQAGDVTAMSKLGALPPPNMRRVPTAPITCQPPAPNGRAACSQPWPPGQPNPGGVAYAAMRRIGKNWYVVDAGAAG